MSPQYGELRFTNGWDTSGSLGHPCKISTVFASWQRYCTTSCSGRQPYFAALNRGRHLCSAGRPSRWALAHILVYFIYLSYLIMNETSTGWTWQTALCSGLLQPYIFCLYGIAPGYLSKLCACSVSHSSSSRYSTETTLLSHQSNSLRTANDF